MIKRTYKRSGFAASLLSVRSLAIAAALAVSAPTMASAQSLIDGADWDRASLSERYAYVAAVSDMISVGARYDQRHAGATQSTFMTRAQAGLTGATIEQAVGVIDSWYRAHPSERDKPVLSVIWREIALPRLHAQGVQP